MASDQKPIDAKDLRKIHAGRLIQRDIDQLLGICEFAMQDGHIDQSEAEAILAWLDNHGECLDTWPANVLYERLLRMLTDGMLDDCEQGEILSLIMSIAKPPTAAGTRTPCSLPLDAPPPQIRIQGSSFCFTGVFEFGSRAECQAAVNERGGTAAPGITKKLNFLVIGEIGSETWRHSSFGAKIAKAVEYRDQGLPISIISETHWRDHLK